MRITTNILTLDARSFANKISNSSVMDQYLEIGLDFDLDEVKLTSISRSIYIETSPCYELLESRNRIVIIGGELVQPGNVEILILQLSTTDIAGKFVLNAIG